jgi:hypothetical protein
MDKSGWLGEDASMPRQNSPRQVSTGIWRIAVRLPSATGPAQDMLRDLEVVACLFGTAQDRFSLR